MDIAVQQTQLYYKILTVWVLILLVIPATLSAATPGAIARPAPPEPLLQDAPTGPCDPGLDQPNYVLGVDVNGNPVAAADVPAARVPVPQGVMVPLKNRGGAHRPGDAPYVELDGRSLDRLLNPPPGCQPRKR
jgi:hypothetical protein